MLIAGSLALQATLPLPATAFYQNKNLNTWQIYLTTINSNQVMSEKNSKLMVQGSLVHSGLLTYHCGSNIERPSAVLSLTY